MELELPTFIVRYLDPEGNKYAYYFSYADTAQNAQNELNPNYIVEIQVTPFPVPEDHIQAMALFVMFESLGIDDWLTNLLIPAVTAMTVKVER